MKVNGSKAKTTLVITTARAVHEADKRKAAAKAKKPKTGGRGSTSKLIKFKPHNDTAALAANALQAILADDEPVKPLSAAHMGLANAPNPELISFFSDFDGNGTLGKGVVANALAARNFLPPAVLPMMNTMSSGYTPPVSIIGEIQGVKPMMLTDADRVAGWELLSLNVNGEYDRTLLTNARHGCLNVRGNGFRFTTVAVRVMLTLINRAGDAEGCRSWLSANAVSTKNVASPDGGRTFFWVLHVKGNMVNQLFDLVSRNDAFASAYQAGRRPLVCFNNVAFSYSKYAGAMELQTLSNPSNVGCPNTTITWVGNYADLPVGFAGRAAAMFAAGARAAAAPAAAAAMEEALLEDSDGENTETEGEGHDSEEEDEQGLTQED